MYGNFARYGEILVFHRKCSNFFVFRSYGFIFSDVAGLVLKRTNLGSIILYFSEIENFQNFQKLLFSRKC